MNLIEKYVEVVKNVHGYQYKTQVIEHINHTLDTDYPSSALNNWASENNPRPVPIRVVSLMRETVFPQILKEVDAEIKPGVVRACVKRINSESAMREQVVRALLEEETGYEFSGESLKTVTKALEVPYVRT